MTVPNSDVVVADDFADTTNSISRKDTATSETFEQAGLSADLIAKSLAELENEGTRKKRKVTCEICLEDSTTDRMRYQGGDQWVHLGSNCCRQFSEHWRTADDRSVIDLLENMQTCTTALTEFTMSRGCDREYSVRALREERSQALVALHRRLRAAFWLLRNRPLDLSRDLAESVLAYLSGSVRRDITPKPAGVG